MTVEKFDPSSTQPVTVTASAISHLQKQVDNKNAVGVIFNVKESGCSGYKYLLELLLEKNDSAIKFELSDNLNLFVQPSTIPLIQGTVIDLTKKGVNYQLEFSNPNATASCGCGESFSVEAQ
ncbi:MAG: iron-sulfur cluster assembly accessory protein [Polaribacter sp.]|jgi:iron-sulfur cluster assembly accessory protein